MSKPKRKPHRYGYPFVANNAHSDGEYPWRLESRDDHGTVNDGWIIAKFCGPDAERNCKAAARDMNAAQKKRERRRKP